MRLQNRTFSYEFFSAQAKAGSVESIQTHSTTIVLLGNILLQDNNHYHCCRQMRWILLTLFAFYSDRYRDTHFSCLLIAIRSRRTSERISNDLLNYQIFEHNCQ